MWVCQKWNVKVSNDSVISGIWKYHIIGTGKYKWNIKVPQVKYENAIQARYKSVIQVRYESIISVYESVIQSRYKSVT